MASSQQAKARRPMRVKKSQAMKDPLEGLTGINLVVAQAKLLGAGFGVAR